MFLERDLDFVGTWWHPIAAGSGPYISIGQTPSLSWGINGMKGLFTCQLTGIWATELDCPSGKVSNSTRCGVASCA